MISCIDPDLSSSNTRPCDLPFGTKSILRKMLSSKRYVESFDTSISPVSERRERLKDLAALRISNSLTSRLMYRSLFFLNSIYNEFFFASSIPWSWYDLSIPRWTILCGTMMFSMLDFGME